MQKIVIERPGGYGRLQIKEFPQPKPGENEVLVAVSDMPSRSTGSFPNTLWMRLKSRGMRGAEPEVRRRK